MVQSNDGFGKESCNYWKLDSGKYLGAKRLHERLRKNNFATLKITSVPRLRELYVRSQRGMLSYEGLSLNELKRFAAQRALPAAVGHKTTIKSLKAQLEIADEEATFDRFLDLPLELRCLIYEHHFEALSSDMARTRFKCEPRIMCQPPICSISREVRQESLPLFYGCCEFKVCIEYQLPKLPFFQALGTHSAAFIQSTSASNLGRIRFLRFSSRFWGMNLELDLTNKKNPACISVFCGTLGTLKGRLDRRLRKRKARMVSKLRKIATDIAAREGPSKLRKTDLKELYESAHGTIMALSAIDT